MEGIATLPCQSHVLGLIGIVELLGSDCIAFCVHTGENAHIVAAIHVSRRVNTVDLKAIGNDGTGQVKAVQIHIQIFRQGQVDLCICRKCPIGTFQRTTTGANTVFKSMDMNIFRTLNTINIAINGSPIVNIDPCKILGRTVPIIDASGSLQSRNIKGSTDITIFQLLGGNTVIIHLLAVLSQAEISIELCPGRSSENNRHLACTLGLILKADCIPCAGF